jgi:sugar/nucleoside kinase (ribokinase family)
MADVTCLGILVADVVGKPVDILPERGKLTLVDRMELHTGGCATNTGIALAKIGVDTAVIGKVGDDGFGDFMVSELVRHGIDPSGIARDSSAATSATMVMVHGDGERSFIHYLGANAEFVESDVNFDVVRSSRILHIAGALLMPKIDGEPTAHILKRAQEAGVVTAFDTAWDSKGRWMSVVGPCLPYIDYAVPSFEEARMITGREDPREVAQVLLDHGVKTVGLKMGENGCFIKNADTEIAIPVYKVSAIDALGAGDAFAAGFLTGLVKGWDLEKTGRFANAVGGLCCTALGATTGIRTLDETLEFMARA